MIIKQSKCIVFGTPYKNTSKVNVSLIKRNCKKDYD